MQDLIDQLRDLVKSLGKTSSTGLAGQGAITDSGINKLINALGQVTTKLDGVKRTRAEEMQAMKRFTANVNRASKEQAEQADEIAKNIQKTKEEADARAEAARIAKLSAKELAEEQAAAAADNIKRERQIRNDGLKNLISDSRRQTSSSRAVFDELSTTGGSLELLKNKFLDLGGDSLKAQAGLQLFVAGIQGTTKALTNMTAAVYKGERGAITSAKALTDFATPILDVIDKLGMLVSFLGMFTPGGLLAKGAVVLGGALLSAGSAAGKLAVKFNELAAEQADKLFKSFREISQVGAAGAAGMDDVFTTLQTLGMSVSEIEDFNKLIVSSGQKLGLLGATAAEGKKELASVAGGLVKSDLGRNLELLGVSAQEQREAALTYMTIQARTGQLQLKNTNQLIQESGKFVQELDMAARLTGQTRKEQEAAREANMAESRFRAAQFAAQQRGDQGEVQRLNKAGDMAALLRGLGLEDLAKGTLQYAASGGAMTTPESIQAAMSLGLQNVLNNPNISAVGALEQSLGVAKDQLKTLAETNKYTGEIVGIQPNIPKTLDAIQRLGEIQKAAAKEGMTVEKFLASEQGKAMLAKGDTAKMTDAARNMQNAALMQDSIVKTYNGAAIIHEAASKTFAEAVNLFAKTVGAKPVAGGQLQVGQQATGTPPTLPTLASATAAESATQTAKATQQIADAKTKEAAVAIKQVKEAEAELDRLKKLKAPVEQQQKAQEKIVQAVSERDRLEQEEIKAAREAAQRNLEARNARQRARREANAAKAAGSTATAPTAPTAPTAGPAKAAGSTATAPTAGSATTGASSYLEKLIQAESGGKNIANRSGQGGTSTSTAFGLTQFTKPTFEGLVKQAGPDNPLYGKTWDDYKQDTNLQREATRQLTDKNRSFLANQKIRTTDSALYLAHFLGPTGATKALTLPDSAPITDAVSPEQLDANPMLQKMSTVGDLKTWADKKMGGVGYAMGGIVSGPTSGYPATLHGTEAIVPLPNGKTIPVSFKDGMDDLANKVSEGIVRALSQQSTQVNGISTNPEMVSLLAQLVDLQRTNNDTASRMLRVSTG